MPTADQSKSSLADGNQDGANASDASAQTLTWDQLYAQYCEHFAAMTRIYSGLSDDQKHNLSFNFQSALLQLRDSIVSASIGTDGRDVHVMERSRDEAKTLKERLEGAVGQATATNDGNGH